MLLNIKQCLYSPTTKHYLAPNVNDAKITKPWFRVYQAHFAHYLISFLGLLKLLASPDSSHCVTGEQWKLFISPNLLPTNQEDTACL